MVKILLDTRENQIYDLLKDLKLENYVLRKQLTLGDIQFYKSDVIDQKESNPTFIVERKTVKDLASSYKDGRLSNQLDRLKESGIEKSQVLYLIEGKWANYKRYGLTIEQLQEISCKIMLGYNFHVYHTTTKSETISFLKQIFLSLETTPIIEGVNICRLKKNSIITSQNVLASQLYAIPGISQKISLEVSKYFNNMKELINILSTEPSFLKSIIIPYKKSRNIDDKIINTMSKYLLN